MGSVGVGSSPSSSSRRLSIFDISAVSQRAASRAGPAATESVLTCRFLSHQSPRHVVGKWQWRANLTTVAIPTPKTSLRLLRRVSMAFFFRKVCSLTAIKARLSTRDVETQRPGVKLGTIATIPVLIVGKIRCYVPILQRPSRPRAWHIKRTRKVNQSRRNDRCERYSLLRYYSEGFIILRARISRRNERDVY